MFEKILKYGVKGMHKGVKTTPETTMSNAPEYKERMKDTPKFTVHYAHKEHGGRVEMHAYSEKEAKNHIYTALHNGHSEINVINHSVHPFVPN
jgi:hypothetical protein